MFPAKFGFANYLPVLGLDSMLHLVTLTQHKSLEYYNYHCILQSRLHLKAKDDIRQEAILQTCMWADQVTQTALTRLLTAAAKQYSYLPLSYVFCRTRHNQVVTTFIVKLVQLLE